MRKIDRLSREPLYQQVKRALEEQILQGFLSEGDLIPSERELCSRFAVSATPVRRALQELVREGLVHRRPGVGSFVSSATKSIDLLLLIIGFHTTEWRSAAFLFSELIGGIANVAWQRQATFSVAHVPTDFDDLGSYLRSVIEEGTFDGVLLRLAGDLRQEHISPLLETGFPYVVIKRYLPGGSINCVINDDVKGAFMATEHLIRLGHTRIGLLSPRNIAVGRDRCQGYFEALQSYDLRANPDLVCYTDDLMEESGRQATAKLLELNEKPTAIFAPSDIMAAGAYRAILEAGLRIPEDIAVVGFDDIPPAATYTPPLTTVRTPYFEFGAEAASLLMDILSGEVVPPRCVVVENRMVVRQSCGAT
jgi:LacI family repressor for deo operon, udp, cdd, tsx, nupC, and nupG